jgi:hypothetical protein
MVGDDTFFLGDPVLVEYQEEANFAVLRGIGESTAGELLCEVELLLTANDLLERGGYAIEALPHELIETDIRVVLRPEDILCEASIGIQKYDDEGLRLPLETEYIIHKRYCTRSNKVFDRSRHKPWGRIVPPFFDEDIERKYWIGLWSDKWTPYKWKKGSFW